MIRRAIDLGDGRALWLLLSQAEHARLSAVLAEQCTHCFHSGVGQLDSVRSELLQAIAHHDDGWAAWQVRPEIDPEHHRPYSFRELSLEGALANSDGSIQRAAKIGPLAAWAVAGHFSLLHESHSDRDQSPVAQRWLSSIAERRAAWLTEWQAIDPSLHTEALADEALLWLRAFDVMSLWICSVAPCGGEDVSQWPEGYHIGPGLELDTRLAVDASADISERGVVTVDPWRFCAPELEIEAAGHVVPVREYQNTDELLAAYEPIQLRWLLKKVAS